MRYLRSFLLLTGVFFALSTLVNAQSEYKYSYIPKKVYKNQLFPVTVIELSANANQTPSFAFDSSSPVQPLSKVPLIVKNGNESFYTFYFKAHESDVHIPKLFISSDLTETSLDEQTILLESLKPKEDFSSVLAADMKIKTYQVSHYDEKHHIVTLSLEAYEANLEDMHLKHLQESGIEDLKRDNPKVEAEFYAVLPITQKKLGFSYFNTIKQQYDSLEVPVEVKDASVTTQSDLNPKQDSFDKLKKYTLMALVGFFFIMFLLKRDFFYLVLGTVSFITLLTLFIPHKKICVKEGAPLYILPTKTSTIGTRIDQTFETMLLGEHESFLKVKYKEGLIGWIKNEDLCEN